MPPIRWILLVLLAVGLPRWGWATDDDITVDAITILDATDERDEIQFKQAIRFRFRDIPNVDQDFEAALFEKDRTAQRAEWRVNSEIQMSLDYVNRACGLTDQQQRKLELAGWADRQRFCDRVIAARSKWHSDVHQSAEYQEELLQLRQLVKGGVINRESFFAKVTGRLLTVEQQKRLDQHRRTIHRALAEKCVEAVAPKTRLKDSQRTNLIELLVAGTVTPTDFGHCEYLVGSQHESRSSERLYVSDELSLMKYYMSDLGIRQIKPLFDREQWTEIRPKLTEFHQLEPYLIPVGRISRPATPLGKEGLGDDFPADAAIKDSR